jgi:hypothetical protein
MILSLFHPGVRVVHFEASPLGGAEDYFAQGLSAENNTLLTLVSSSCSAEGVGDAGSVKAEYSQSKILQVLQMDW